MLDVSTYRHSSFSLLLEVLWKQDPKVAHPLRQQNLQLLLNTSICVSLWFTVFLIQTLIFAKVMCYPPQWSIQSNLWLWSRIMIQMFLQDRDTQRGVLCEADCEVGKAWIYQTRDKETINTSSTCCSIDEWLEQKYISHSIKSLCKHEELLNLCILYLLKYC